MGRGGAKAGLCRQRKRAWRMSADEPFSPQVSRRLSAHPPSQDQDHAASTWAADIPLHPRPQQLAASCPLADALPAPLNMHARVSSLQVHATTWQHFALITARKQSFCSRLKLVIVQTKNTVHALAQHCVQRTRPRRIIRSRGRRGRSFDSGVRGRTPCLNLIIWQRCQRKHAMLELLITIRDQAVENCGPKKKARQVGL